MSETESRVAVVIPCHNEEVAIESVVSGFREALPQAAIVVVDNASNDRTGAVALRAGARVISEPRPGKGIALRRGLADVEADCYVMVDGDGTYDPRVAPDMVRSVLSDCVDMVTARRVERVTHQDTYRTGHRLGNAVLTWIFQKLFALPLRDTLSGYRCLSRRLVRSFPGSAVGFEIEAELNAHAATLGVPTREVDAAYFARAEGSESKLRTYRDGLRILRLNLRLFRDARPALSFSLLALPWIVLAAWLVGVPVLEYLQTGLVARFPSLIAGVGCFLVALNLVVAGLILARVTRNRTEAARLAYLAIPAYSVGPEGTPA